MSRYINKNRRMIVSKSINASSRIKQILQQQVDQIKEAALPPPPPPPKNIPPDQNNKDLITMHPHKKTLSDLIHVYMSNRIDYNSIKDGCEFYFHNNEPVDLSIIIPVLGRENFTAPLISHFQKAMEYYPDKKYSITFVEHGSIGAHRNYCYGKANHIWIKKNERDHFNKCLAMNVGALFANNAEFYLFHDLDLLMKEDFFENLFKNLERTSYTKPIQAFGGRRIVVMDDRRTTSIINKDTTIGKLIIGEDGSTYCAAGAPGGSIFISKKDFFNVGGFDAEFFHSYSCEDAFFYDKLLCTIGVDGCNEPLIDMFHMNHPRNNGSTNPDLGEQRRLHDGFTHFCQGDKLKFIELISGFFIKNIQ